MSTGKAKPGVLKVPGGVPAAPNRSKLTSQASQNRLFNTNKDRSLNVGVASRTTLNSSSRKSQIGLDSKIEQRLGGRINTMIQVFDDAGSDVTPQPLLVVDPNAVKHNQSKIFGSGGDSSGGTPTDLMSQASIYQTGNASFAGPFTRSVFGTSMTQSSRSAESFTDDFAEPAAATDISTGLGDVQTERQIQKEVLTEEDLDKVVTIQLSETDTIWMLDLPGISLSAESDEAATVKERNEKYKELCKSRDGNDRYAERGMQTFNEHPKNKDVQTTKIVHTDTGITASTWDMYDTYEEIEAEEKKADEEDIIREEDLEDRPASTVGGTPSPSEQKKQGSNVNSKEGETQASMMASSMAESEAGPEGQKDGAGAAEAGAMASGAAILQSDSLKKDLFVMERVVTLNNFQQKQASFRGLPILTDIDRIVEEETAEGSTTSGTVNIAQLGPNLDRLWAYTCSLTKGRNVSCMSWNRLNNDLLAVGYGQFGFTEQKGGLACCWSIKNPEFPERVFHCESGVTAMDFSTTNPNLLAIGMYNGMVAIYNVRGNNNTPVLDSYESHGKHAAPVWQLKWIDKEKGSSSNEERGEILISVSTDGRVTQWQIRKGFECADLMKLKRVAKASKKQKDGKEGKSEGFISRQASGMCFDFNPKDLNIYLAGTEEGLIHKCSCSYNEQYLDSYFGHTGPVYKIEWSPFLSDVFISGSADWSMRLWVQDRQKPVLNFFSSTKAVMDVSWSPNSATVFGCVNEGAVEIWDLSTNMLDPIIVNVPAPGIKLSCLQFALNSNCILVGDNDGQVSVYQLRNMPPVEDNQKEKLEELIMQTLDSELQSKR